MQSVAPFLWFDRNAEDAAGLYVAAFAGSKLGRISRYGDGAPLPRGTAMVVNIELAGQTFMALNGGPHYQITPSISFFVHCDAEAELAELWQKLAVGGTVLMPVDHYPFSPRFGWVQDRFGVSWQLNLGPRPQKIAPFLMFSGAQHGRAEEAIQFYTTLLPNSRVVDLQRFAAGEPGRPGTLKRGVFTLGGREFMAIDSPAPHAFSFSPGVSLYVNCETQSEVDELWNRLAVPGQMQQCGWLTDKFGVSWQIIPSVLGRLMDDPDRAKAGNVVKAMLQMKKIDIAALERAYAQ